MELTIYTYGHLDAVYYVLNAIAMVLQHEAIRTIFTLILFLSLSFASLQLLSEGAQNIVSRMVSRSLVGFVVFFVFFIPAGSLQIVDKVSKRIDHVDNLPIGFVAPIAVLEALGEVVTEIFEQAFRTANNFEFSNFGMIFGANTVQNFRSIKIQSPELSQNFSNFCKRCIVPAVFVSEWFSVDELNNEKNIWKLLKRHYPTSRKGIRRFDLVENGQRSNLRCAEGMAVLERQFNKDMDIISKNFANTILNTGNAQDHYLIGRGEVATTKFFKENLSRVVGSVLKVPGQSSGETMQQIMLLNSAAHLDYGYDTAQAIMRMETGWSISAKLATEYLPILMVVLKCLVYASFIFVIPMMLLSGDFSSYYKYLILVFSFQLWPALFVILNFIVDLYSSSNLAGIANESLSYANFDQLTEFADKISTLAGGMMLFIPMVAFQLASGGIGALANFAGSVISGAQMNISGVATEAATGNRSLDNVSMNNTNMNNTSSNKHDANSLYADGKQTVQQNDGSQIVGTANGDGFSVAGGGISKGQASFRIDTQNAMHAQMSSALNESDSIVQGKHSQTSHAESVAAHKAVDIVEAMSRNESASNSWAKHLSADEQQHFQHMMDHHKRLHAAEGYNYGGQGEISASANLGKSLDSGVGGVTGGLTGGLMGKINSGYSEDFGLNHGTGEVNTFQKNLNLLDKIAKDDNFSQSIGLSEDARKNFSQSFNDLQEARFQEQVAVDNHQSLQNSAHRMETMGVNVNRDVTHEATEYVAKQMSVGSIQAANMLEHGDKRAWTLAGQYSNQIAKQQLENLGVHLPSKEQFHLSGKQLLEQVSTGYQQNFTSQKSTFETEENAFDLKKNQQQRDLQSSGNNLSSEFAQKENAGKNQVEDGVQKIDRNKKKFEAKEKELDGAWFGGIFKRKRVEKE